MGIFNCRKFVVGRWPRCVRAGCWGCWLLLLLLGGAGREPRDTVSRVTDVLTSARLRKARHNHKPLLTVDSVGPALGPR